jgi:phage terminase large subunit-like protein
VELFERQAELTDDPWSFACPDWAERLADGRSLMPDLPLDVDAAAKAMRAFNTLRLPDVAGFPALADAAGDWQREPVGALFGSIDESGRRRVQQVFELVPKKSNKTTGAAAKMMTALILETSPQQAYRLYGPTQAISDRAFAQAEGMIRADDELQKRFQIQTHLKTIRCLQTESTLKVQTFDERIVTGEIIKGALIDEVHILGKVHYASRVLGQLTGGMIARPDAFLYYITTQSDEPPAGVFKELLTLARGIRDGRVNGKAATLLPLLYEFPEELQTARPKVPGEPWAWEDSSLWHRVLPNLGRSIRLDVLETSFAEAKAKGEVELRRWASQHLNIEIGLGMHAARWRGADHWEPRADKALTLDELLRRSEVVVAGVDGGGLDDLFALVIMGRCRETRAWLVWTRAWVNPSVLDLRKDIASRLQDFVDAGDLVLAEGDADVEAIAELLAEVRETGLMPEDRSVGLDPQSIGDLVDALKQRGFEDSELVAVGQGYRLFSAVSSCERRLAAGTMFHGGQDLLTWAVGNCKAEQRGNAVVIEKTVAGKAKIDPVIAMLNAAKLMERGPDAASVSKVNPYAERGLIRI